MYSLARYYAAVATMAVHDEPSDIQGRALARLVDVLGTGAPPPARGVVIHDGEVVLYACEGMAAITGRSVDRLIGSRAVALAHASRRAGLAPTLRILLDKPATMRALLAHRTGRAVTVAAAASPVMHEGRRCVRVECVDVVGRERLS